jgi:hypothetical protein
MRITRKILAGVLSDLVGDTGVCEDVCECDNTTKQNNTVCSYCYAKNILQEYQKEERTKS